MNGLLNAQEYAAVRRRLENEIVTPQSLPHQIFRRPDQWTFWIFDADFVKRAEVVNRLARAHGEVRVHYTSLHPTAEMYQQHCGILGAFTQELGSTFHKRWSGSLFAQLGSPGDALAISSTEFAVFSDSGRWIIYGDAFAHLGIVAQKHVERHPVRLSMCTQDEWLKSHLHLEFNNLVNFEIYFAEFSRNYLTPGYRGAVFQCLL